MNMTKRSPRFTEVEMHALIDGCIKRWNTLNCNINSDIVVHEKEEAWKKIQGEVAVVSTAGVIRRWTDLRRKIQVERSNVKRKVQEIRRTRGITGNVVDVPGLTEVETKIASLLTSEEVCGISGYTPLGCGVTAATNDKIKATSSANDLRNEEDVMEIAASTSFASPPLSRDDVPTANSSLRAPSKKRHRPSSSSYRDLQAENLMFQNENLKLQKEVLILQKEYYSCMLEKLRFEK